MRQKRTKQLSKEELLILIKKFDNDKIAIARHLGVGQWSLREQLKRNSINFDKRIESNAKRKISKPSKEYLTELYKKETILDIAKILNVSNVTVSKWFEEYGIEKQSHSETIKTKVVPKIIETNKVKYGYDHFYQTLDFKEKAKNTLISRYGVPFYPVGTTSKAEIDVLNFFNTLNNDFEKKRFNGIELDGYSETLKVAFEYCGLYWHSESKKGRNLHRKKYEICKENNIRLFTIFEDEWINRNNQVKGFIRAALGKNEIKLYARKLKFKKFEKNNRDVLNFLNENHIQGKPSIPTTLDHYVLMNEYDQIISCLSIGRHHRNSKEIVISRYCTKSNTTVVGGSKKLFHYVLSDYKDTTIKTWSDNRWTEGDLYSRLNFSLLTENKKDYSYIFCQGKNLRRSKQSMSKKNLNARSDQTEYERALELGFDRIWDCGKKTWVFIN